MESNGSVEWYYAGDECRARTSVRERPVEAAVASTDFASLNSWLARRGHGSVGFVDARRLRMGYWSTSSRKCVPSSWSRGRLLGPVDTRRIPRLTHGLPVLSGGFAVDRAASHEALRRRTGAVGTDVRVLEQLGSPDNQNQMLPVMCEQRKSVPKPEDTRGRHPCAALLAQSATSIADGKRKQHVLLRDCERQRSSFGRLE